MAGPCCGQNINIKVVLTVQVAVRMDFNTEFLKLYACALLEDGHRFSCRSIVCVRVHVRVRKTRVIKILQYVGHGIKNSFRTTEKKKTVCIVDSSS